MTRKVDVLILGGGLAGLSTAYHLKRFSPKTSWLVAEKRMKPGGLAGSVEQDGFVFDHTGHLLHLHDPYGKKLILDLLGDNVHTLDRSSWIYSHGVYTRYPFQANTCGLPPKVVQDCVAGFMKTVHRPRPVPPGLSFKEWCLRTFGEGISKHFMVPYNEKLWNTPLDRMTTEWQGRFLPKPLPEEVLYGSLFDQRKFFGYNASFRYPIRGGIQVLPDALAARVGSVSYGCEIRHVDLAEKTAVISGLGEVRYERLVNTMPLKQFLGIASPLPAAVRAARDRMKFVSVYNLNIGIARANISDKHWIYFPENKFPFYRAGFTSNFSPKIAPKGATSMYIEVSRKPHEQVDFDRLERGILDGLRACGILKSGDKLLSRVWLPIPCAYVVYDFERTPAVRTAMTHLASRGVESIGRYGGWKYSFMEETILDGKRCAERLLGRAETQDSRGHDRELKPLK
ncbi:MAG: FAD-dependent oxidoreductase [Elusimicrobia bacterium]|nr:FAD-dependent oxidoreductase [Elusimicrobiota bacterium]